MSNLRFRLLSIGFFLGFLVLIARLFYWQVAKGGELSERARNQYTVGKIISAPRGEILAYDRSPLVVNEDAWRVYASPQQIKKSVSEIADLLAPFFVEETSSSENYRQLLLDEAGRLKTLLAKNDAFWVPLKNSISTETKKNIEAFKIDGIGFEIQEKRGYPESSVAAHILGFVGKNEEGANVGYFGLEGYYDLILSGKSGFVEREKDARGVPILLDSKNEVSASHGVTLVTNIDKRIQLILDRELRLGIERYGASAGVGIIMEPKKGAILAMSSFPSYDPGSYWDFGNEFFKNPAVSDTFEPGSVFKVIVMASGLDAKVVTPDTKCDICQGPFRVDKYLIETWNKKYNSDSTMTDVIIHSDNVGMVFVSQKLGPEALYDYLDKFGIGKISGIDLQGEVAVPMREKGTWNEVDLATSSFGQGIVVTPIAMLRAVSAIANGGYLVTPQVVKELQGESWKEEIKADSSFERVISSEAAKQITEMMVKAASEGESKWTNIRGFKVAGKTGTAQIPIAGHYDAEKTIASFVGFAPANDPKFIMIITLREPKSSQWASETAAPLWYKVAGELFPYLGIHPEN